MDNSKGFWEDFDIVYFNEELLRFCSRAWYSLEPIQALDVDKLCNGGYLERAIVLLREKLGKSPFFGFKDPRTAKLLPFWIRVFDSGNFNVRYVVALRNPVSVVKSLAKRDNFSSEHSYFLWIEHVLNTLSGINNNSIIVDYDSLMLNSDVELRKIAEWLGTHVDERELEKYRIDFLDEKLRHSQHSLNDINEDITTPAIAREIYAFLVDVLALRRPLSSARVSGQLIKWEEEFKRFCPAFRMFDTQYQHLLSSNVAIAEQVEQLAALRRTTAERDEQIASLDQILDERRVAISRLDKILGERDLAIERLTQTLRDSELALVDLNEAMEDRDQEIARLNQMLQKQTEQISSLGRSITEQDERVITLHRNLGDAEFLHQQYIAQIKQSMSWKLTAPVRFVGGIFLNGSALLRSFSLFIQGSNGFLSAFKSLFRLAKDEGLKVFGQQVSVFLKKSVDSVGSLEVSGATIPQIEFDSTKEGFNSYRSNNKIDPLVKVIAFYLPQFHPFPENDEWWGKGFTEWTNVGKAKPNYVGHYQPHCPIHFGYYDLRIPSVMEEQARLAKEYGLSGFNYYFYWFGGKILMDTPLEMMLSNEKVDIPFCLTWANENWSRRWDGQENDILISQKHSDEDSVNFILHLVKYFSDDRYIKIDGKPLLIIYRPNIIPNIKETAILWRKEMVRAGFPGIYLVAAQTFGARSPEPFGFDASMQFPPHTVNSHEITNKVDLINEHYTGHVFSYDEVVSNEVASDEPSYKLFRTAMLSWDNTARKQNASHIFHGFSLLRYKQWLAMLVNKSATNEKYSEQEKFVFINAWNEWAEGTHLEPDQKYGYGYLQATYDVVSDYDKANLEFFNFPKINSRSNDCAIVLHVHYADVLPEIKKIIENVFRDIGCDIFVTTTSLEQRDFIRENFSSAYVMLVENRGRDILPFIKVMRAIDSLGYKYVCKIHTKKSLYRNDGDKIRKDLYQALLADAQFLKAIFAKFDSDSSVGMIVPDSYLLQHNERNMVFNWSGVNKISKILKISFDFDYFPAGSMFWFRPEALRALHSIDDNVFEIESGFADGTMAHAVERFMGHLVKAENMKLISCSAVRC
jgi:lipopolysaccharide biosynthesis protein